MAFGPLRTDHSAVAPALGSLVLCSAPVMLLHTDLVGKTIKLKSRVQVSTRFLTCAVTHVACTSRAIARLHISITGGVERFRFPPLTLYLLFCCGRRGFPTRAISLNCAPFVINPSRLLCPPPKDSTVALLP